MKNVSLIFVLRYQSEYHWEKEQKLLIEVLLYQKVLSVTVFLQKKIQISILLEQDTLFSFVIKLS